MLYFLRGNLFDQISKVEALINTVNCFGVMGKGVALEFKKRFPLNFIEYKEVCDKNSLEPGKLLLVQNKDTSNPTYIINFPTKNHWRQPSKIEYIEEGLKDLVTVVQDNSITSIAMPALGCGNGGLDWEKVKKIIIKELTPLKDIDFYIYEPSNEPSNVKVNSKNKKMQLTDERKLLLLLIHHFNNATYKTKATYIEGNYLAYLAQVSGTGLNVNYEFTNNGPFAASINNLLLKLAKNEYIITEKDELETFLKVNTKKFKPKSALKNEDISFKYNKIISLINGFENHERLKALVFVMWFFNNQKNEDDFFNSFQNWVTNKQQDFSNSLIIEAKNRMDSNKEPIYENLSLEI